MANFTRERANPPLGLKTSFQTGVLSNRESFQEWVKSTHAQFLLRSESANMQICSSTKCSNIDQHCWGLRLWVAFREKYFFRGKSRDVRWYWLLTRPSKKGCWWWKWSDDEMLRKTRHSTLCKRDKRRFLVCHVRIVVQCEMFRRRFPCLCFSEHTSSNQMSVSA